MYSRLYKKQKEDIAIVDWDIREERLLDLLDTALSIVPDSPIYEQYNSRNIVNYLSAIKIVKEIKSKEELENVNCI